MNCPKCSAEDTKVIDSRVLGCCVRRRRECETCHYRFSTYENPQPRSLKVVKKDNVIECFDITKIKRGLEKSFKKRPFSEKDIEQLAYEIEQEIHQKYDKRVKSIQIGQIILNKLSKVDKIAYLRFASVYKNFRSVKTFTKEIKKIDSI